MKKKLLIFILIFGLLSSSIAHAGLFDWFSKFTGFIVDDNACSDGTADAACSIDKPLYCDQGALIDDCSTCGCSQGYKCADDGSCEPLTCRDGTIYGSCSTSKPYFCARGVLSPACSRCECPSGYECRDDGACEIPRCRDGTAYGSCSEKKPYLCVRGRLTASCTRCGCSSGYSCVEGECEEIAVIRLPRPVFPITLPSASAANESNESDENITNGETDDDTDDSDLDDLDALFGDDEDDFFDDFPEDDALPPFEDSIPGDILGGDLAGMAIDPTITDDEQPMVDTICEDETVSGECSSQIPMFCDNGVLVEDCNECGCPDDMECSLSNVCIPRQEDADVEEFCEGGCVLKLNQCIYPGTRAGKDFCAADEELLEQRPANVACTEDYECVSNSCIDGVCAKPGVFRRITHWLYSAFA